MLQRILNKISFYINKFIAYFIERLQRIGWIKPISYKFSKDIRNAIFVNIPKPVNYNSSHHHLFEPYTDYETAHEQVFELEEVWVSDEGVVSRRLLNFRSAFPHPVFRFTYGFLYLLRCKLFYGKEKLPDTACVYLVFDFWSAKNYYHWIADSLPRILQIKEDLAQKNTYLLIPEKAPVFIFNFLEILRINNFIKIKEGSLLYAKKLYISNYTAASGQLHPEKIKRVREIVLSHCKAFGSEQRIYVSRSRQKARRIFNEKKVVELLSAYGFKTVYFEELTLEQQVGMVSSAKYFISSHGANMTNLLFLPKGAKVLELIREDVPNFCYWQLASISGMDYYYQLCPIAAKDHLFVNLETLKQNLDLLLSENR